MCSPISCSMNSAVFTYAQLCLSNHQLSILPRGNVNFAAVNSILFTRIPTESFRSFVHFFVRRLSFEDVSDRRETLSKRVSYDSQLLSFRPPQIGWDQNFGGTKNEASNQKSLILEELRIFERYRQILHE